MDVRVQNGGHPLWRSEDVRTEPWKPGETGKAIHFREPDGSITFHVWKTNWISPHHAQVVGPMRKFDERGIPTDGRKIGPGYEVDPDGNLTAPYQSKFDQYVPAPFVVKTQPAAERWHWGKIAGELPPELQAPSEFDYPKAVTIDGETHVFDGDKHSHLNYVVHQLGLHPSHVQHYWAFSPYADEWENLDRFIKDYQSIYDEVGPQGLWDFNTARVAAERPLEIIELSREQLAPPAPVDQADMDSPEFDWWNYRRPFVYYPEDHQVVIGPTGTYHSEVAPRLLQHADGTGAVFVEGGGGKAPQVRNFGNVPPEVIDVIAKRFGVPVASDWKFGTRQDLHGWRGGYGKGFLLNDGSPVTWSTDEEGWDDMPTSMGPHHVEYATSMGLAEWPEGYDEEETYGEAAGGWHTPVYISPEGVVTSAAINWPGAEHQDLDAFYKLGLKPAGEQWNFAKVAERDEDEEEFDEDQWLEDEGWLTPTPGEPLLVQHEHPKHWGEHYDLEDEDDSLSAERPVLFDGSQFHVGEPNAYHWDLIGQLPHLQDRIGDDGFGGAPQGGDTVAMGRWNPDTNEIMWGHKGKYRRDHFNNLMYQAFGSDTYDQTEDMGFIDDDWHFGGILDEPDPPEEADEEWENRLMQEMEADIRRKPTSEEIRSRLTVVPPINGKGILLPDGSEVFWETEGTFGWPHHQDVAQELGYRDITDVQFVYVENGRVTRFDEDPTDEFKF